MRAQDGEESGEREQRKVTWIGTGLDLHYNEPKSTSQKSFQTAESQCLVKSRASEVFDEMIKSIHAQPQTTCRIRLTWVILSLFYFTVVLCTFLDLWKPPESFIHASITWIVLHSAALVDWKYLEGRDCLISEIGNSQRNCSVIANLFKDNTYVPPRALSLSSHRPTGSWGIHSWLKASLKHWSQGFQFHVYLSCNDQTLAVHTCCGLTYSFSTLQCCKSNRYSKLHEIFNTLL